MSANRSRALANMRCTHVVAQSEQVHYRSETSSMRSSPTALNKMRNSFCPKEDDAEPVRSQEKMYNLVKG
jgi:hypothetical protein